jgi:hypothetical protein
VRLRRPPRLMFASGPRSHTSSPISIPTLRRVRSRSSADGAPGSSPRSAVVVSSRLATPGRRCRRRSCARTRAGRSTRAPRARRR